MRECPAGCMKTKQTQIPIMIKYSLLSKLFGLGIVLALGFLPGQLSAQNATIGDFVWNDLNSNGIQDTDEPGMEGVYVVLQDANGLDIDFVITDANGHYSFLVAPGSYRLKFANPGGVTPSPQDATSDDNDSDQDLLGFTPVFTLAPGETNNNLDGGFMAIPPGCSLTATLLSTDCGAFGSNEFSFILNITGGGPWGWTASNGQTGHYDEPATFGPFPTNGGDVCLDFVDMDNPTCTGTICVTPPDCPECDPLEKGGEIGESESRCGPYNPAKIQNLKSPSGGSGDIEYMWLASHDGCPLSIANRIFGADGPTYDPPTIFKTTYYVRWARRKGCPMWTLGASNCIVKEVITDVDECGAICESRRMMDATSCGAAEEYTLRVPDFLLGLDQEDYSPYWHLVEGQMTEFTNGSAKITGRLKNNRNTDMFLDVDIVLNNRTFHPQPGSPNNSNCFDVNDSDWYYYTNLSGTLTGHGALEGGVISVSGRGPNFQAGTGANLHDANEFGASSALNYTIVSQPDNTITFYKDTHMNLAFTLTGGINNCIPDGNLCENNSVLFIVGDLDLDESDAAVKAHLEQTGYSVTTQLDYLAQPWDAMGHGLVLISSTSSSAHLDGTFTDVAVPVMNYEAWVHDNLNMTKGGSNNQLGLDWGKYITLTNNTHPISAGRLGNIKVYNMGRPISWGVIGGDGVGVAIPKGSPGKYAMFAYDQHDLMMNGAVAPARRVGFFMGDDSGQYMTEKAWELFDASVAWAIDCRLSTMTFPGLSAQGNPNEGVIEANHLTVPKEIQMYPNPASGNVFVDLSAYDGEDLTITIYNQIGQPVRYVQLAEAFGLINMDISDLNPGYHVIQFETASEGVVETKKLLIRP
ncbi:MAG: T9SS C-terminal target domain-containing protein [Bacteroidetes bacterium]|nr:MAG: T9SS C-terminal target domain-containing protein [Bacteroidota bacterium]